MRPHDLRHTFATHLAFVHLERDPDLLAPGGLPDFAGDHKRAAEFTQNSMGARQVA